MPEPIDVPVRGNLPAALMQLQRQEPEFDRPLVIQHDDGCPTLAFTDPDKHAYLCNCEIVTVTVA